MLLGRRTAPPGRDGDAAPLLRCDVADGLSQLPPMTSEVLKAARTFTVLKARRLVDHSCPSVAGSEERRVHIGHPYLDHAGDAAHLRWHLISADIGNNDSAVVTNAQLSPVRLADTGSFFEAECLLQPRDGGADIGVNEHRCNSHRRRRTIGQHGREHSGVRVRPGLSFNRFHQRHFGIRPFLSVAGCKLGATEGRCR